VEALNCGIPLIVADNRGTREYAVDGYNAIVEKAKDVEGFRDAILRLYTDKNYRTYLASNCRSSAKQFGIEQVEETMRDVYGIADCAVYGVKKDMVVTGERTTN
jgi:glycosyltransferase involved in cell wall biosynthesis